MLKRLLASFAVVLGFFAGSAHAQLNCTVENNFSGAFSGPPGNYSITVTPGQNGTLRAVACNAVNNWNWSPGSFQTSSITITAPQSGSISYTLTGCNASTKQCGLPATITLQVAALPPPDCTLVAAPNPASSGQTVTFTATCSPDTAPAVSINYSDLSGVSRTSTSLTFADVAPTVTTPTTRTVLYHGNAANGAVGPLHSLAVLINPVGTTVPPPTNCTLTANPNPVTLGQTTLLTATCGGAVDRYEFLSPTGQLLQNTAANTVVATPPAVGASVYSVTAFNAGGSQSVQAIVNVVAAPPAPPSGCTLTASPNPIVLGASSVLTGQCTSGGAATTYTFRAPDGTESNGPPRTFPVTPATVGNHTYTFIATNAGGSSPAATATVTVQATACTITPSVPNPVQRGSNVVLTAACNFVAQSYTWSTSAGSVGTGPTLPVTPAVTTTYTVNANNGSTTFPLQASAQYTVVVIGASAIAAVPGAVIIGQPGRPLSRDLQARVTDAQGNPVANEAVSWTVVGPGSSPGTFGSTPTSTNAQGVATNTFTYGSDAGGRTLRACLVALPTVCADFQVVPGASTIASLVGSTLTGSAGKPLSSELQVRVADSAGTPVAGEFVNWTVVNPGASPGSFGASRTGPTDAQGVSRNTFTLGNDTAARTLRACLASLPAVCVDIQVNVTPAATGLIVIAGEAPLIGAPGRPLSRPLQAQARNAQGLPVAGQFVNWSVVNPGASPGTFTANPTGPTNDAGITTNTFTMGNDPGGRTLRACLVLQPAVCVDFVVTSLAAAVEAPATKIMSPLAELAVGTPLTQLSNIRFRLDQLRLRRNPSVIEALRVRVAGQTLPSWSAFAVAPVDKNGKPAQQKGGGAAADDPFERLGVFVNGELEFGRQSSTGVQPGFDLNTTGITAGVDYRLPNDSVIGIAAGLMNAKTDLNDAGGGQGARGYSISAYGSFVPMPGAYVDVIAHAGGNKYDTRRREISGGTPLDYEGNTKGDQYAVAITAGADLSRGGVTMNPYVRLDYVYAKINGFSETGSTGAISVGDMNLKTTVLTLGGQVSYAMSTSWGVFMPNARLELQRRAQGSGRIVSAQLVADPLVNSQVALESVDRDYGNMSIGFSAVLPGGVSGFANYERLFGRQSFGSSKFTVGLRFEF